MSGPILLLEDEPLIAIDVEDLLHRAGWTDVATFSSCNDADEWLKANTPTLAIVDPHLRGWLLYGHCPHAQRSVGAIYLIFGKFLCRPSCRLQNWHLAAKARRAGKTARRYYLVD